MDRLIFSIRQIAGLQATGELKIIGEDLSFPALSGKWGKGYLPLGEYKISAPYRMDDVKKNIAYKRERFPWMAAIVPQFKTDRDNLAIHPDGNIEGTLGCIGLLNYDTLCYYALKSVWKKGIVLDVIDARK